MKSLVLKILLTGAGLYAVLCALLYIFQERLLLFPERLPADFKFAFEQPLEELQVTTADKKHLSAILFKADSTKGLVFYLHGNAGSLRSWGEVAGIYTSLGYDVCMMDYRGFGKSEGSISSQQQFLSDVQLVYDSMKQRYPEQEAVVLGYSLGTGAAAWLASVNHPRLLVLQAPYYSLTDAMHHTLPFVPGFILKYKLPVNEYLARCNMPVTIFHGTEDEVIYYGSSLKLRDGFKSGDSLITLEGQGHDDISFNPVYLAVMREILSK